MVCVLSLAVVVIVVVWVVGVVEDPVVGVPTLHHSAL